MKRHGVAGEKLGVDFIDLNMINHFNEMGIEWVDGMSPMMDARAVKNVDEQECSRIVGAISISVITEYFSCGLNLLFELYKIAGDLIPP